MAIRRCPIRACESDSFKFERLDLAVVDAVQQEGGQQVRGADATAGEPAVGRVQEQSTGGGTRRASLGREGSKASLMAYRVMSTQAACGILGRDDSQPIRFPEAFQ